MKSLEATPPATDAEHTGRENGVLMANLTCYKLRTPPEGPVSSFPLAIRENRLNSLNSVGPTAIGTGTGQLFITKTGINEPAWGGWLRQGFGDDAPIPKVGGAGAVLVVRIDVAGTAHYFAFTLGTGFLFLRPDAYVRGFGLRTALNVVFEGDDGTDAIDPARLRSIDAKRVGTTVLRSRHQVSDSSSLEELDVDVRRDLLNGVTGTPVDKTIWGPRITGKDSLTLSKAVPPESLDQLCLRLVQSYEADDYKTRFAFVDDMQLETDPTLRSRLEDEVLGLVQAELIDDLGIAPPDLLDWEKVVSFQFHTDRRGPNPVTRPEMRLPDYLAGLKNRNMFDGLTTQKLRDYEIFALDGSGQEVANWSAWRCIYGSLTVDGSTYVLDEGDFYRVSEDYLQRLSGALDVIPESPLSLPGWPDKQKEDEYNKLAAESSPDYLLLDRKTVKVARHTTQVEICDVLTADGIFLHVKRKSDGSSSLSHLFAQGFVSGDLLVSSADFRKAALQKIAKAEDDRAASSGDDSFKGRFSSFSEGTVDAAAFEVVYAMLGEWTGGLETLPFFSKIMLVQIADDLRRRNLKVSVKLVPAVSGV